MDFLKNNHRRHHSSATSNRSFSDADSQLEDIHSPLRADSPLRSDDISSTSTAIVAINNIHTPFRSPLSKNINVSPKGKSQSPAVTHHRISKAPAVAAVTTDERSSSVDGVGIKRSRFPPTSIVTSSRTIDRLALGFRVCEMILSLIALSVMASDKTQGWSGDSFDRYMEYRYLVAVNAIAFTYAAFQAIDHTYLLLMAYLLMSSSSSAASRVDDWVLNWGEDEFTKKASASVVMSFLTFLGFASSSLISGYNLCDQDLI
ncbi:hypothetical protein E3N88_07104 [Mikania micrantha]|uniref:CASP-like protein n=1 Tax=Mikania micrantha TaxID=192012 RepID=A0A5N6PQM6_9ASTR|nr:hypothetical protein E3N88_07104 [Mikania micrantha]